MTDKIPPRPEYPDAQESPKGAVAEYWKQRRLHTEAVAKVAMRFARKIASSNVDCTDIPQDVIEEAFELVKAVDESGWTP